MTRDELFDLTRRIDTAVVQAPNDLRDGSGTIYAKLYEFEQANGSDWVMLRAPIVLDDGSLLAILVRVDPD